jgi:hypothetical protein
MSTQMNDPIAMSGRWLIFGKEAPPYGGVLSIDQGDLCLKVTIPNDLGLTPGDVMRNSGSSAREAVPKVIFGRDGQDKPVSLFGCMCSSHTLSQGEQEYEIDALAGVQGIEIESWHQPVVRSVLLKVEHFHRWLGAKLLESGKMIDGKKAWFIPKHEDLVYPITDGIHLRICQHTGQSSSADGFKFTPDCQLWLTFENPRSLEEVTGRWVHWVVHFLSLLIGTSVRCEEITVSALDLFSLGDSLEDAATWFSSRGTILGRTGTKHRVRISDPDTHSMLAPFASVKDQLGEMLRRWQEAGDRLEPVLGLFSAVVLHHSLYSSAEFLFLIQALEVYHARSGKFESTQIPSDEHRKRVKAVVATAPSELREWLERKVQSGNYKHLDERLLEVFRMYQKDASKLFGDFENIAGRIAYTRNHLTHYNNDTDSERYLKQTELAGVNFHLENFLWIILLRELGAPESAIEKVLRRSATVVSISLDQSS